MQQPMLRFLFQNSRIALAFVVLTVLAAVAMIGPRDNGGLVTRAVSLSEGRRGLLASDGAVQAANQVAAPPSVFGEYNPQGDGSPPPAAVPSGTGNGSGGGGTFNPMTAPMAPGAVVAPPGAVDPIIPDTAEAQ